MIHTLCKTVMLAASMALAMPASGGRGLSTQQQGLHQWPVKGGKLILVTGTYQDATTYKRSLTFYLESRAGADWLHVPIITSETDQDTTWFSVAQGEQTVADAVVLPRAGTVDLVMGDTKPGGPGPVTVRRYRLSEYSDDQPYGPAYYFKKTSSATYPASARLTVEQVLSKEAAAQPKP